MVASESVQVSAGVAWQWSNRSIFNDDFMLRRLDYLTDVLGGVAAHYCYDHVTIDGLIFPTLRRVVRRTPEGPLLSGRTSFILDYTDLVIRE